ncbi:hypothetical protein EM595_1325 [Duffyella gerundensis]|uniref:Uncharacterized protein n=1 Tax=Duffyella gerundensis TaxID=1619313 RepID=A0A0U5L505_9GAMM|nr:hypothetical protein EM595_1325 [Duffyella gerundensis]
MYRGFFYASYHYDSAISKRIQALTPLFFMQKNDIGVKFAH